MSWSELPRYEWILVELLVLGILVWQLISVRRSIRADRAARAQAAADAAAKPTSVTDM